MTKADLVEEVVKVADVSKKHAETIVNTVFNSIVDALQRDDKIELRGFGSFRVRHYGGYTGRNPKTNQAIEVKPKYLPVFKVGKSLRARVNGEKP